jgi:hypothetical protein
MTDFTQEQIDELKSEALLLAPHGKMAELEADIKAKAHMPLAAQVRFLTRVIDAFEAADIAKYQPEPPKGSNGDNGNRRPDKSNPWSTAGWNTTHQGRLVVKLGEKKATQIAEAAGCKLGSTCPNPSFN